MALIACVVYDPPGEPRTGLLTECLVSIMRTVQFFHEGEEEERHRFIIVNNGICPESQRLLDGASRYGGYMPWMDVIGDGTNIGTARAINKAWQLRKPGEHCLKVDSDVVFHEAGWLDRLEECIARDPRIGQIGLKRGDLDQSPLHPPTDWRHSKLKMLPHRRGQNWLIVEQCHDIIGTCVLHSSALLDKVGYLYQYGGLYGCDDGDMSVRSECAGFYNCFLCNCPISHPDPGGDAFTKWKQDYAGPQVARFQEAREMYKRGTMPLYHGPDDQ